MIIEHRTFRPAAGVEEADLLDADRRVQTEAVPFRTGFIRRTTARGDDGRWLVETLWFDDACADAGSDDPIVRALDAMAEAGTLHVERWATLD